MDPQEITEELEHPGARNLLASATLLRLAYNGSDGFPRVVPIGFYWNGNQIVVCTATTAPKAKALSSRPNLAITIDVGDTPAEAKALLVRGRASAEIVDGAAEEYLAASAKAMGGRPARGLRAPGQVALRPDGTYLHRAGLGAVLRLRCWAYSAISSNAGERWIGCTRAEPAMPHDRDLD